MTDNLSLREQSVQEPDEGESVVEVCGAKALADTAGESNRDRARDKKSGLPTLGRADSQSRKISPKALPGQLVPATPTDSNPPILSGEDFYHAACVEAHRLLNLR